MLTGLVAAPVQAQRRSEKEEQEEQKRQKEMMGAPRCAACVPPSCALHWYSHALRSPALTHLHSLPAPLYYCTALTDYKYIMRDEAMVTGGELAKQYERAEDYEDDFM